MILGTGISKILAAAQSSTDPTIYENGLPHAAATGSQLHTILQLVISVIAALSVLMIVIAGLRFITGQGNPQEISKARNTIVYALVGLLLAIVAESIVSLALKDL